MQREAAFYQHGVGRPDVLVTALRALGWDWHTALHYLAEFSENSPELLDALVREAISPRGAGWAAGALRQIQDTDAVAPRVLAQLPDHDAQDWRQYAGLLWSLDAFDALAGLLTRAASSQNDDFTRSSMTTGSSLLRWSASRSRLRQPRTLHMQHGNSRDTEMTRTASHHGDRRRAE